MSINVNDKNLGHATAYAYYKAGGGTMTEAEFTEFMADFGTASQTAVEAAQAALASKNAAQTAATTATNKASEATTAATTATNKAAEAQADADAAALDASQAMSAASTATTKATEATTAAATATSAKTDAVAANTAAQSAKTAAQTAQTGAETAAASVQSSAEQIATNTEDIAQLKSELSQIDEQINGIRLPIPFAQTGNGYIYQNNGVPVLNYDVGTGNNQIMVINDLSSYGLNVGDSIEAILAYNTTTTYYGIAFHTSAVSDGTTPLTSGIAFDANKTVQTLSGIIPEGTVSIVIYNRLPLNADPKIFKIGDGIIDVIDGEIDQLTYDVASVRTDVTKKTSKVADALSDDMYSVGDIFTNEIGLHASNNGTLNLVELKYNGESFKNVGDDISPICLSGADYAGANHGYNFGYECTCNSHGLSFSDIGKTYSDGANTWVLIKVIDQNVFQMVCYDSTKWYKVKTATVPATVDFGKTVTISDSTLVQIYPSVKNGNVYVSENSESVFRVAEQYDVIDLGTAIDSLIENVGNNTNDSLVQLADAVIHHVTTWEFNKSGSIVIYQQIENKKAIGISLFSGSQCMAFENTDLLAVLGTTFPNLQNSELNATKDKWVDGNKAPSIFIKTSADKSKGFAIAYLLDRTADIYSTAGYVQNSSKKLYPCMVQPSDTAIKTYGNIIIRFPFVKNENGADYLAYAPVGKDVYVFVGLLTSKTVDIVLDADIYGKTVEVVDSNNITVNTQVVIASINVTSSGEGFALLKVF